MMKYFNSIKQKLRSIIYAEEGFSMLELLIYVTIVGILVSIAIPKYNQAVSMANTTKIQADMQTINTAIAIYQTQNGTSPSELGNLSDYIANLDSLKPPQGNAINASGNEEAIPAAVYTVTTTESDCQATLGENSVSHYMKSGS